MPHSVSVIVTGRVGAPLIDGHYGYVAGRYRDGLFSDVWTDVSRCASGTFTAYAPACTCGWHGDTYPSTASGLHTSREALIATHLDVLARLPKLATLFTPPTRVGNRPALPGLLAGKTAAGKPLRHGTDRASSLSDELRDNNPQAGGQ